MVAGPSDREPGDRDLRAELEAERAATDHWRRVARQRSAAFAELRHRPTVRAVLALERRLGFVRHPVATALARLRALSERTRLALGAVRARPARRLALLQDALHRLPAPPNDSRRIALVVVGRAEGPLRGTAGDAAAGAVDVTHVDGRADAGSDPVSAVRRAIDSTDHDLVGVLLASSEPLDDTWLRRLAREIHDDTVAVVPLLVHPHRARTHATPHDGRVRASGLTLAVPSDGAPELLGAEAGSIADPNALVHTVESASSACIVFARAAYRAAGGLTSVHDLDIAIVELCARLRAGGGRISVVPSAVMIDRRPVRSRRDLRGPVDPTALAWADAVDRFGPALVRSERPPGDALRFVLTVAAPSLKTARQWGDWHLADALAGALRRHGHEARVQTADRADDPAGRVCDVHIVLRGLEPVRRTPGQRHVLWIISHPESIEDEELDAADLVLVASPPFAAHLASRTATPVEVLLQATDARRFHPRPVDPAHRHAITVVAKTRDVLRPVVVDALSVGLRPAIYGSGWRDLVDPALVVADHVDNEELPIVYSSADVVLNDHWRTMQRWGFVSNRLYDVLACGIPVISDPVVGIAELFDGAVLEYHSPRELRDLVDEILAEPAAARARAERGREAVLAAHTFDQRASELLKALARHTESA